MLYNRLRIMALMKASVLTLLTLAVIALAAGTDAEAKKKKQKAAASQPAAEGQEISAKEKDIRHLLEISGGMGASMDVADQIIENFRVALPNVPSEFWDEFRKDIHIEDLVALVVPIYDKHLTHDDVKGLIEFYESPTGKKFASVQNDIAAESFAAGQQWGEELGRKVIQRMQEQGRMPAP